MMFNLFKKKKPIARFYSLQEGVADLYPIIPTASVKRPWIKLPSNPHPNDGSIATKNCPGIKLMLNAGWVLTAPADFIITTDGDGVNFKYSEAQRFNLEQGSGQDKYIDFHDQNQTERILDDPSKSLKTVVKIHTPWRVELDDDYLLLQVPVHYSNEKRFTPATGLLDPRYAHVLNVQLFWHVLNGEELVKAGTPLIQYIPIPRKAYVSSHFNFICDEATDEDRKMERSFNYTLSSVIYKFDSLKSRLVRVRKVIDKYRSNRRKK